MLYIHQNNDVMFTLHHAGKVKAKKYGSRSEKEKSTYRINGTGSINSLHNTDR